MISNTRRVKAEKTIDNIVAWLKDELKYDSLVVNGTETMTDGSDDIIMGRYEVCRDLLHFIRSIRGETHDDLDSGNIKYKDIPKTPNKKESQWRSLYYGSDNKKINQQEEDDNGQT